MFDHEAYLRDFHSRRTGASPRVFAGTTPDGQSSYARLAAALEARPGDRILDLACGDGPLLEALRILHGETVRLEGIDMTEAELEAARMRLGDGVPLHCARAQDLPFADATFERVGCHMAFMLMRPLEAVIAELTRVVRPGGRFAATIGGPSDDQPHEALFWRTLGEVCSEIGFEMPRLGDPILRSAGGLEPLFGGGWERPIVEDTILTVQVPGDELWAFFVEAYYPVDLLPEAARSRFRATIEAQIDVFAPGGTMTWTFGVRQIVVDRV